MPLLSTYYLPGTVLSIQVSSVKEMDRVLVLRAYILVGETDYTQVGTINFLKESKSSWRE